MLRTAGIITSVAALLMAPAAWGSFTTWFPSPGEPDLDEILENLYGMANLERVHDAGPHTTDGLWYNSDAQVTAQAKFAGKEQTFGYLRGATGWDFVELFTVDGNGYLSGQSATFSPSESGNPFRFSNKTGLFAHWSSNACDNWDWMDHMVTYRVNGPATGPGDYVLAWEDKSWFGDRDYNDLIVEVSGVSPVPEPATLSLLGLGAVGLIGGWRARRRRS
ncbi:MAG: PEP-CTERM sorting domain-containing protein [Candidatus Eisenbacteria bacterium]|nr:PEP-CTERM sorting domain-containing protein [Candidatus Eisenbacteria bacterium]